jgi:hypothetical protein
MNGLMEILLGFITGSVVASGLWAVLWVLVKKERRADKARNEIIRDIASECAEIENYLIVKGMKRITIIEFQSKVSPRLDKITMMLSTHMDTFDVYYVKYIESLIARYREGLLESDKNDKPEKGREKARPHADMEVETLSRAAAGEKDEAPADREVIQDNFDQTWQIDFPKLKSEQAVFEKNAALSAEKDILKSPGAEIPEEKSEVQPALERPREAIKPLPPDKGEETVFDRVSQDVGMKDTKIIKTESIPQEKQSEIEQIIIAELNREPGATSKPAKAGEPGVKKKADEAVPEFGNDKGAQATTQPKKTIEKEKNEIARPPQKDENFISGEDLVAKLDSFFGIKD